MHLQRSALHLILFQLFLKLVRAHTMQSARSKTGGYIIFIRHGHRAPGRNIMQEADSLAEIKLWKSHIFSSDQQKNSTVAVKQHPINGIARDLATRPFGCITTKGREHLQTVGRNLSAFFPDLKNVKNENLLIYSTNYQRTQARSRDSSHHICPLHAFEAVGLH
jgi:Histidine phosphatase superfamily (branch 2)